jgi:pimeloyl-ACP methyl ester carboxylesterase
MSPSTPGPGPRARFTSAYQRVVDHWPVTVTGLDAPTDYGTTHLLASGDETAPAVLLLPGGSATAAAWSAVAGELSRTHRVVAVDPIGGPGLSAPGHRPLKTAADLASWLDQVLDYLGVQRATIAGHSYGAWLALRYAIHAPARVSHLVLLDPATCFAPLSLAMSALVVVAARSRAHDSAQITSRAREWLPRVTVETLAQATHHTIPTEDADELTGYIESFLARA